MLSHVRIRQQAFIKQPIGGNHTQELQAVYSLFSAPSTPTQAETPPTVPSNPFLCFQPQADADDEIEQESAEDATCVYKHLQIGKSIMIGVMLMSNGAKIQASRYSQGADGFITCHWDDGETLETEIPNAQVEKNGEYIMKPCQVQDQPKEPKKKKEPKEAKEPKNKKDPKEAKEPKNKKDPKAAQKPKKEKNPKEAEEPKGKKEPTTKEKKTPKAKAAKTVLKRPSCTTDAEDETTQEDASDSDDKPLMSKDRSHRLQI